MDLLPSYQYAYIPDTKIRDYVLNPNHEEGKHKALVFHSALGLKQDDFEWLVEEIKKGIRITPAQEMEPGDYGKRYVVDLQVFREGKSALVRTSWILRGKEDFPRLTSCYII